MADSYVPPGTEYDHHPNERRRQFFMIHLENDFQNDTQTDDDVIEEVKYLSEEDVRRQNDHKDVQFYEEHGKDDDGDTEQYIFQDVYGMPFVTVTSRRIFVGRFELRPILTWTTDLVPITPIDWTCKPPPGLTVIIIATICNRCATYRIPDDDFTEREQCHQRDLDEQDDDVQQ